MYSVRIQTISGILLHHLPSQTLLYPQGLSYALNYGFEKVSTRTALLLVELMWIKCQKRNIINRIPAGQL